MTQHQEGAPEAAPGAPDKNQSLIVSEVGLLVDEELEHGNRMTFQPADTTEIGVSNGWLGRFVGKFPRGVAFFFLSSSASLLFLQSDYEGSDRYRYVVTFMGFGLVAHVIDVAGNRDRRSQ